MDQGGPAEREEGTGDHCRDRMDIAFNGSTPVILPLGYRCFVVSAELGKAVRSCGMNSLCLYFQS
jgi:hypothetical protein